MKDLSFRIIELEKTKYLLKEFESKVNDLKERLNEQELSCNHEIIVSFNYQINNKAYGKMDICICPVCGGMIYKTRKDFYLHLTSRKGPSKIYFQNNFPLILDLSKYFKNHNEIYPIVVDKLKEYAMKNNKSNILELYEYLMSLDYQELLKEKTKTLAK